MPTKTIPLLPCVAVEPTVAFYEALGFTVAHLQTRPYLYLALALNDVEVHFKEPSPHLAPAEELSGGALVMVDDVTEFHRSFADGLRRGYGRILATGLPRLTRLRPAQSRFSLYDPSGNCVLFINHDESDIEYGGSGALSGLAKAHDNVRNFRDFKNDDALAARAMDAALNRFRASATRVDVARALADRAELDVALGDHARAAEVRAELSAMELSDGERTSIASELTALDQIEQWMA